MALDPATARAFLLAEARPAMLATTRPDGSPHVAPIWVDLDGDDVLFNTGADTVKGRNLAADPRVAISVQDDAPPYSFVTAFGTATLIEDLGQVRSWAGRIGGRYLGADRAAEMAGRNGVPGELLVRVHVDRWAGALDIAE
jgi:PPOX class probable F420-dependent enzyme